MRKIVAEVLIAVGFPMGSVFWTVEWELQPRFRPRIPDPARGFLTLTHNKFGDLYTTAFERWVHDWGATLAFGLCFLGIALWPGSLRGVRPSIEHPRIVASAAAVSLIACIASWWVLVP